ncbi:MAG: twin-arginine translocation signal domain-containing protein [Acidobacteriaceae bacterium]|nr:twin-arginine translocation signal domain-containing protein [Acidobacteriaceae bacterium]
MSDDKTGKTNADSRRDFLGKLGAALGGAALAGGGSIIGRAQGVIPNGYQFYPILIANDNAPYPGGWAHNPVGELTAAVMLGSAVATGKPGFNVVYFHGTTTADPNLKPYIPNPPTTALFLLGMDYTQPKPALTSLGLLTFQGDTLTYIAGVPSSQLPLAVTRLGTGACNSLGHYATTIFSQSTGNTVSIKNAPGVYLYDPQLNLWTKVARFGDPIQGGGAYGADFGDVAIDDDDNVTIVAAKTDDKTSLSTTSQAPGRRNSQALGFAGSKALIHHPRDRSITPFVLAQTGDMLPETNAVIRDFGLIDVAQDGSFVAQVSAHRLDVSAARPGTAIVTGSVKGRRGPNGLEGLRLLAASPRLLTLRQRRQGIQLGECILGPRIASENLIGLVTHDADLLPGLGALEGHQLAVFGRNAAERVIAATGDRSMRDWQRSVSALSPPCSQRG